MRKRLMPIIGVTIGSDMIREVGVYGYGRPFEGNGDCDIGDHGTG